MNNDEKAMSFYDERHEETRSSSPFDEDNQSPTIKRDDSIDLASVIKQAKEKEETTAPTVQRTLSPLEQMQKDKENQSGMIVSNEELEKGKERTEMKNPIYNDRRMADVKKYMEDIDSTYEKRKHVVVIKFPQMDTPEHREMLEEIESLTKDENGEYYFDIRDSNNNLVEPKYVRLRTKDDPVFEEGMTDYTPRDSQLKANISEEVVDSSDEDDENQPIDDETKKVVEILIDKTGLGINYDFSENEKSKIYESQEIRLTEVEFLDIESIMTASTPTRSFKEDLQEFELTNSKTTVCLPCSGYRAQMKGMTYGELGDVSLMMDSVTFDQYYKRMTVMYNKMTNVSTGPFEDFEDFLKKTAYNDIPMGLYGMYVATQPEIQQIRLQCGNEDCKKNFDWKFNTRSVLRLEKCTKKFLDNMKRIATAPACDYKEIQKAAPVNNSKFIKLPDSKFVIELGIISAYEFLYNFIPVLDENTFREQFGESETYLNNVILLTSVRSVSVPKKDGSYVTYKTYKDILDVLYEIHPDEIKIISSIAAAIAAEYQVTFAFDNVTCPHCGTKTESVEVSMDDLVFRTYQQSMSTQINVKNMQLS